MNSICLVIDRLHSGYLGAYGNTWIDTRAIDALAAESFVFDQMLIDTPKLDRLYRSFWQGRHAATSELVGSPSLPAILRKAGVRSTLLTDDPSIRDHPLSTEFDDCFSIEPPTRTEIAAEGAYEDTHLARCFGDILTWLESARQPFMLWCHLGSLGTIWDAPLELRSRFRQEGDPPPLESAAVPNRMLNAEGDRSEWARFRHAYAGQISLLDMCVEGLLEALREHPAANETLLTLCSSRGFPLGEHLRLGACDHALHGELVHVPFMLRFPNGLGAAVRSNALLEPSDLWATVLDCFGTSGTLPSPTGASLLPIVREEPYKLRDRLLISGPNDQYAIRTPAWYYRDAAPPELYAKPDDRCEANNVATRCQEVVEQLREAAEQLSQAIQTGTVADLPLLPDVLVEGVE